MKKILLITNADMGLYAGNVTLITRRATALYRLYGAVTTCVLLGRGAKTLPDRLEGLEYARAPGLGALDRYLDDGAYGLVILYGERLFGYAGHIRRRVAPRGAALLLDMQGCLEEQTQYSRGWGKITDYIKYGVKRLLFRYAAGRAHGILTVTDALGDCCDRYMGRRREGLRRFRIRCGLDTALAGGERLEFRRRARARWGVREDTTVLVFAGYRMPWQRVDETIEFFQQCDRTGKDVFFAFFCDADGDFAARLARAFPNKNYVVQLLPPESYMEHLCGCDAGFLMRDYSVVNTVAFPNKFSDYINAGLLVAMGDTPTEPSALLRQWGLPRIDPEGPGGAAELLDACGRRRADLPSYYQKCDALCRELLLEADIAACGIGALLEGAAGPGVGGGAGG